MTARLEKNDVTTPSVANAGSKDNIEFNDNGEQATLKKGTNGEPLMVGLALTNTNSQTIFCDYLWKIAQAGPSVGTSVKRLLQEIQDTKSSPLYNDDSDIAPLKALVDKIELNYPNQETTDAALSKVDTDSQLISPIYLGNHNRADPKLESPLDTKSKPGVDNLCSAPNTIDTLIVEIGNIDKENEETKKIATSRVEAEASKTDSKVNNNTIKTISNTAKSSVLIVIVYHLKS